MKKLKRINNDGLEQIVIKARSGQQLNQREAQMINDGSADGFLLFDVVPKGSTFRLVYSLYDLVPLTEFLQTTVLSSRMFGMLLRTVLDAVKRLDTYRFSKDLLQFDLSCVMMAPGSGQIYLLYIPIQPYAAEGTLKEMLLDILRYASFDPREDLSYVQNFIRIINDGVVFSAFTLDAYVDALTGVTPVAQPAQAAAAAAPVYAAEPVAHRYDPAVQPGPDEPVLDLTGGAAEAKPAEAEVPSAPPAEVSSPAPVAEPIPASLTVSEAFEEDAATVCGATPGAPQSAWLERRGDPRRYEILRSPYRIGKMREGNDQQIPHNTVSRKHAEILLEKGRYYLVDLNSTNGTYLDGRRIEFGVKEELQSGVTIRFANEEFVFYTE